MDQDLFARARLLVSMGRTEEADPVLTDLLARHPDHAGALMLQGNLLSQRREYAAALPIVERAALLEPRSAEAHNAVARCLHALGRDREALARAETARGLLKEGRNFGQAGPVYLTLVWCHRELREYREAIAAAEEGLALVPDAVLAQWASQVEQEMIEAEKERC